MPSEEEDHHLWAKEAGLRRNPPCRRLDLRLPASRLWDIHFFAVAALATQKSTGSAQGSAPSQPPAQAARQWQSRKPAPLAAQPCSGLLPLPLRFLSSRLPAAFRQLISALQLPFLLVPGRSLVCHQRLHPPGSLCSSCLFFLLPLPPSLKKKEKNKQKKEYA